MPTTSGSYNYIEKVSNEMDMSAGHTHVVLLEELLGVVVAVNVDLCESIVNSRVLAARLYTGLQPRQDQLEPVTSLNLVYKFIDGEVSWD